MTSAEKNDKEKVHSEFMFSRLFAICIREDAPEFYSTADKIVYSYEYV